MIDVKGISKRYGPHFAVSDVSFRVDRGEVVGFLGPNGAGKSTTMNILTGYLSSTTGEVLIDGSSILEDPRGTTRKIGYLPEVPPLYLEMTVREYLSFVCRIKLVPAKDIAGRVEYGFRQVGIADVSDRRLGNLSKGYRQRAGIAQALMGNPDILILDEPTAGLDPNQIIEIRNLIRELGESHTVILSSHILPEVSQICNRVIIINRGRIVADGEPSSLGRQLFDTTRVNIQVAADEATARRIIATVPGVAEVALLPATGDGTNEFMIESEKEHDLRTAVFQAFCDAGVPLMGLRMKSNSLEELFLELTGGAGQVESWLR